MGKGKFQLKTLNVKSHRGQKIIEVSKKHAHRTCIRAARILHMDYIQYIVKNIPKNDQNYSYSVIKLWVFFFFFPVFLFYTL